MKPRWVSIIVFFLIVGTFGYFLMGALSYDYDNKIEVYTIFTTTSIDNETFNETIGYAFEAKGAGYGGTIEMLVTLSSDLETLNGIAIINHMETPGLGAKIEGADFTGKFKDVAIKDLNFKDDGGQIDAITGATVSSRAITNEVRRLMDECACDSVTGASTSFADSKCAMIFVSPVKSVILEASFLMRTGIVEISTNFKKPLALTSLVEIAVYVMSLSAKYCLTFLQ